MVSAEIRILNYEHDYYPVRKVLSFDLLSKTLDEKQGL